MATDKTSLGDRMKGYESAFKHKVISRMPVVIRLDGKAFHTYTKSCDKPFDKDLHDIRVATMKYLCENIQGCIIGYSQSDEITLVLKDYTTYKTCAWFDNQIQKIVSIAASMCSSYWNSLVVSNDKYKEKFKGLAFFDARVFNLPTNEVVNCLLWRQQDWERNSVQMLARSFYSQKQCHGKSCKDLIVMREQEQGVVWGELESWKKRGEFYFDGRVHDTTPIFKEYRSILDHEINYTEE